MKQSFTEEEKGLCQNQNGKNRRLGCLDMYSSFLKHVITKSTRYQSPLHLPMSYFIELSFITLLPRVSKYLACLLETTLCRKCMEFALFPITLNAFRYSVLQHPFQVQVPVGLPEATVFKTCFPEIALPIWLF